MPNLRANGVSTHYHLDGEGPHITLIHGVGGALDSWDCVVSELARDFQLLRYDLRGHGESGRPPGPYALDDFVEDFCGLLGALRTPRTNVVGFSLGGLIAQAIAVRHPEVVAKLAIVSAVAGRTAEERRQVVERANRLTGGGAAEHAEEAFERWFTPEYRAAHPEIMRERAQRATAVDPEGYAAAYRVFAESDLADELHGITAPTLVMTGEHDPGSNTRMARLMHDRIAGSRRVILPRLRHAVLTEAPGLVAKHLREFLDPARP